MPRDDLAVFPIGLFKWGQSAAHGLVLAVFLLGQGCIRPSSPPPSLGASSGGSRSLHPSQPTPATTLINVGHTVSARDWEFTVVSVENTGLTTWSEWNPYGTKEHKAAEDNSFWKLKTSRRYKGPHSEEAHFHSNWIMIEFATARGKQQKRPLVAVITDKLGAVFSSVHEVAPPYIEGHPGVVPRDLEFLFIAPADVREISSMSVRFLDYQAVPVISPHAAPSVGQPPSAARFDGQHEYPDAYESYTYPEHAHGLWVASVGRRTEVYAIRGHNWSVGSRTDMETLLRPDHRLGWAPVLIEEPGDWTIVVTYVDDYPRTQSVFHTEMDAHAVERSVEPLGDGMYRAVKLYRGTVPPGEWLQPIIFSFIPAGLSLQAKRPLYPAGAAIPFDDGVVARALTDIGVGPEDLPLALALLHAGGALSYGNFFLQVQPRKQWDSRWQTQTWQRAAGNGRPTALQGATSGVSARPERPAPMRSTGPGSTASDTRSHGRAPCTIGDGYRTVRFSDGATYSGSFESCKPLPGPARYQLGATVLDGQAEPIDDHTVRLKTRNAEATITLEIH